MIPEKVAQALNRQLNAELYSAYLYLSMSAYFEGIGLRGFAHWMRVQAKEELGHAMKIFDYLAERGARIVLEGIERPPTEWESPSHAVQSLLQHEQKVTGMISDLMRLARESNDYATEVFLHWFVEEQVEEEDSARQLVDMLRLAGDKGHALMMIDRQLAQRKD